MDVFEFDGTKSQANLNKHGIDFMDAQQLWNDPYLLEVKAKCVDEPRYLLIGKIGDNRCDIPGRAYSSDFGQAFPQERG